MVLVLHLNRVIEPLSFKYRPPILLCTAAVEPTTETPEDCNNIINHVSEVGGHLRMDRAVGIVPDFLDVLFDGAG